ncbi:radical SAM protein [Helicobacter jaachi]|uniref:Radical SAM protein n=1 Tax=Helicobacter jaachi TaxID=1677920 RepID=A0A4U8TA75_9HELI|nr:radical SAM protein [Helicobacter jaachi]TLD96583.1 radical SAM protein [Helicobacter jaachi]
MNIVFGPVHSRRFGRSLGVDLSPFEKQCNFDCVYCELAGHKSVDSMRKIVSVDDVIKAVKSALNVHECDVLTLTANGEPTLYPYLQELISNLKKIVPDSIKLLLLTNGSLLWKPSVRSAMSQLDMVKFSCDSLESRAFKHIDRPHSSLKLTQIKEGIATFCKEFKGEIIAEVLFVKGINDTLEQSREIAAFLASLPIHRVDIGSIDRPPAYKVEAVSEEELKKLAACFYAYPKLHINLPKRKDNAAESAQKSYSQDELIGLIKRRPLSINDAQKMLDSQSLALLYKLCQKGSIKQSSVGNNAFYQLADGLHKKL